MADKQSPIGGKKIKNLAGIQSYMNQETAEQIVRKIIDENGSAITSKVKRILIEDANLRKLSGPLKFVEENWHDHSPALMRLSCEAVGGKPEEIEDAAIAFSLMNLSFTVWDDLIDDAPYKVFRPTLFGKYGQALTVITGGIAAAKAFTILDQSKIKSAARVKISETLWKLCATMASEEAETVKTRLSGKASSTKKFSKIRSEAADLGSCLKIGAIIGDGSAAEIVHLDRYGRYLSVVLSLRQDLQVSLNLTVELPEKIKNGKLPYCILWAKENSEEVQSDLKVMGEKENLDFSLIKKLTKDVLDTNIVARIGEQIENYRKKADAELDHLTKNPAQQSLRTFVDLQPSLLFATAKAAE